MYCSYRSSIISPIAIMLLLVSLAHAETFKSLPPPGIEIDGQVRERISARVAAIEKQLSTQAQSSDDALSWTPDVEVFTRAVRFAVDQNLFYKPNDVKGVDPLLDEAERRLKAVADGDRGLKLLGWNGKSSDKPTLVVGGFRSRIDDSVQPYGMVVPAGYQPSDRPMRLDVWLHGRGDTQTEVPFLKERMTKVGQYSPADTFVLHPFGRHCVAFKFAGETDVYESIDHVGSLVPIDPSRVAMRGFSMGGAGVWHLAVHDPARWFAVNPGAGFVDTIVYQKWTEKSPFELTASRRKLLNWYDVLPWASNLRDTKLVAYSGEVDGQRQAAERVIALTKELGIDYQHIIGKDMGHKIDPPSAKKIDSILARIARNDPPSPRKQIDFVTFLLRYHSSDWLSVEGLQEQFSLGRVRAEIVGDHSIRVSADGITRLRLNFSESGWPGDSATVMLDIDGQKLEVSDDGKAKGLQCEIYRDGEWKAETLFAKTLRKRPGMQGPIDDAFCERFVFVSPSRPATHGVVQRWIDREMEYASQRWQTLMRGDARWVKDTDVTDEMIATCNLVCFGDFASNRYLASVASGLPVQWNKETIAVGTDSDSTKKFDPVKHAAVFCYPNPRNPEHYIVVNSGITFREFSNTSNSRQIAMLPDWAILDVSNEDDSIFAGDVVADGFFDEQWKVKRE